LANLLIRDQYIEITVTLMSTLINPKGMARTVPKRVKPVKPNSESHEGEVCQKFGSVSVCGTPEDVKQVMTILTAQEEKKSKVVVDCNDERCPIIKKVDAARGSS